MYGNDFDPNSKWFTLVQSEGASDKGEGEGGSFGIGKGAPLTASELRTVFYLTVNSSKRMIFQGVAELVNFKKDGQEFDGCGFYGFEEQKSIRDAKDIDHKFWSRRKTRSGLDVFIMGYRAKKNDLKEVITTIKEFTTNIFSELIKS